MQDELNRRTFLGGTAAAVAGTAAVAGETAAHYVGQPVYATTDLNVRDGPGSTSGVVTTVEQYTGGYIIDGPVDADGYRWWKCRWNDDCGDHCIVGWSADEDTWMAHASVAYPLDGCISSEYYDERSGGYHTQHWGSSCGNYSLIDHGGGYETLYCRLIDWMAGDGVNVGNFQHIAEMGVANTGVPQYLRFQVRRYGDPVYVPGAVGDGICARTGVSRRYSGLSRF